MLRMYVAITLVCNASLTGKFTLYHNSLYLRRAEVLEEDEEKKPSASLAKFDIQTNAEQRDFYSQC